MSFRTLFFRLDWPNKEAVQDDGQSNQDMHGAHLDAAEDRLTDD